MAEGRYNVDELRMELVALFDREEDKRAASLLINWFDQMARHKRIRQEDYNRLQEVFRSREEVHTMLVTTIERHEQAFYEKGREEGRSINQTKVALGMIRHGFPLDQIAEVLELSVAAVEEIIARATTAQASDDNTPG